jgi:hypothetical protein
MDMRGEFFEGDLHVIPIDDLIEHYGRYCECEPRYDLSHYGELIIIHNAWDARELIELNLVQCN